MHSIGVLLLDAKASTQVRQQITSSDFYNHLPIWNQQTGNTSAILDLGLVNVARGQSVRRTSIGLSAPENMVIASVIL